MIWHRIESSRFAAAMVALALATSLPWVAHAEVEPIITMQGRLMTKGGTAVPDGSYGLTVNFYEKTGDLKPVYTYVDAGVAVKNGVFSLAVGAKTKLETEVFYAGKASWVGLQVGTDPELPWLPVHQVPYALRAQMALDLTCTGCIKPGHLDASVLADYAKSADVTKVSDDLAALSDTVKKGNDALHKVATSGKFDDLADKPTLVALDQKCKDGEAVSGVDATGKVVCVPAKAYTGKDFALSGQACAKGEFQTGVDADGKAVCGSPKAVSYSGADFALSDQACGPGSVVAAIGKEGKVVCQKDEFYKYTGVDFAKSKQACPSGQVLSAIDSGGTILCVADKDTTYSGKNFALSNTMCPSNRVIQGFTDAGQPVCVLDQKGQSSGKDFALSDQKCATGKVVSGVDINGAVICELKGNVSGKDFALSNQACPKGQVMTGVDAAGKAVCATDANTTYSGKNFALANSSCPAGQVSTGVDADGKPKCSPDVGLAVEWVYGWGKRSAASGKWLSALGWGEPMFTKDGAYTDTAGVGTKATETVDFPIPSGARTAYVSFLSWNNGGYFDIYLLMGGKWKFHRRVNSYQDVSVVNSGGTHDGNTIALAATGLNNFTAIRIANQMGRLHFSGLGFSREDKRAGDANGFVHWNNVINKPSPAANQFTATEVTNLKGAKLSNGTTPWTAYVKKAGDTMTGNLTINPDLTVGGKASLKGAVGIATAPRTDSYKLAVGSGIHMNNKSVDYVSQLHFNDNVRLYEDGNDNYLNFKYGDAAAGGIRVFDGNAKMQGVLYSDGDNTNPSFGLLDSDGNWAVQVVRDAYVRMYVNNGEKQRLHATGANVYGTHYVTGAAGVSTAPRTDSYKLAVGGNLHMNNHTIDYVQQLHFNDNVRFYEAGNDNYLNFKYGDAGAGGIRVYDGDSKLQGSVYADGDNTNPSFGLLDSDGNWAVQVVRDNSVRLVVNNSEKLRAHTGGVNTFGSHYITKQVGINTAPRTDGYYLAVNGSVHMNNGSVDYVNQLHFNDNVRFYDVGNNNYLAFKWGNGGGGGIRLDDGDGKVMGYLYADGNNTAPAVGILDSDANWGLRIHRDTATELYVNNKVELSAKPDGVYITDKVVTAGGKVQRDLWTFNTGTNAARYIHIKTNISVKSNIMYRIVFEGYNYGRSREVFNSFVGYAYAASNSITNIRHREYDTGLYLQNTYKSSDGYVCLRAYGSSVYYLGFSVSAWMLNPAGAGHQVAVLASKETTSSANQW